MIKLEDFEILIHPKSNQAQADATPEYPVIITSLAGSTSGILRLDVTDAEFQSNLTRVSSIEPNVELREKFGGTLFNALFNDVIRDRWNFSVGGAEGLRIRLDIQAPELAMLPWELMYHEDIGFLSTATNFVLSRYLRVLELPQQRIEDKVRVLLIAQSPQGLPEILAEEFDQLQRAIAETGDAVELTVLKNKPLVEIQQALERQNFHILHFLGHGIGGSLALTNAEGQLHRIEDDQFAQLLQGHHSVKLVVLNACSSGQHDGNRLFSGVGPALVKKRLPAVIAMQYPAVNLSTAANFSKQFYAALANGYPIDLAVNQARNFLFAGDMGNSRDWSTPVLYIGTRRSEMLFWSLNKKPLLTSAAISVPQSELPETPIEYITIIQTVQYHAKGLDEWLRLNDEYLRLQVVANKFADHVNDLHQSWQRSDLTMRPDQIKLIESAWGFCVETIERLQWMSEEFNFILPKSEPLPDKRNFVHWISELSELGAVIQEKIDQGRRFSNSTRNFLELRKKLSNFYPDLPSMRRIVDDSGIDQTQIEFDAKAINSWHSILKEAEKSDRIDALLDVVGFEYRINDELQVPRPSMIQIGFARNREPQSTDWNLGELNSATIRFVKKLEQRSRGPLNVVRDEVKCIDGLITQAVAKISPL